MLRNSRYVENFMFQQPVVKCFSSYLLVSGFGFHLLNIIFWVGNMIENGKESILKKKNKKKTNSV